MQNTPVYDLMVVPREIKELDTLRFSQLLQLPLEERVALLMEDYDFFVKDTAYFCDRLEALTTARGKVVVQGWQALAQANQCEPVVRELLTEHYDPVYLQSMQRNFKQYPGAKLIAPDDHSMPAMVKVAQSLVD